MRILICDDEAKYVNELNVHVQEYMKNHFIQCSIDISSSPKEVLKKNKTYDLVFLDIQMPEINGLEIAHKLKERNSKVVIFL